MLWRTNLPALNVRTVGVVGIGFEPSALTFEVIRLKGSKTTWEALVDLYNFLQCVEDMFRTVQIGFNVGTIIKCNGLCQLEYGLNIAGNAVGYVLPAHAAVAE